jgi:hypothetical protein
MIKFFRKIRQRLLTENKFSKYLLYAIGEIVLVVIGIMIALQVNNWNQNRKQLDNEVQLYSKLYNDLNSEYLNVAKEYEQFSAYSKFFSHIYNETTGEAQYNNQLQYNFFVWFHRHEMFIKEKYSEELNNITNDNIHQRLKSFISVEMETNVAIDLWNEYQLKEVRPYLNRQGINKTKAMFSTELDGFASAVSNIDFIEYSKLKEQYGSLEFDQLLFTIQFQTNWAIQNIVWLNENNLRFQDVLKKELELHGVTENIISWENEKKYIQLINEADVFYETKEYQKSANKYEEAFTLIDHVPENDRYNAACSFALSENIESAFNQLFIIAKSPYSYHRYDWVTKDSDLNILHNDQRWNELISVIRLNQKQEN